MIPSICHDIGYRLTEEKWGFFEYQCGISFASFSYFFNMKVDTLLTKPLGTEIIQLQSTFHPQMAAKSLALVFWIVKKTPKSNKTKL